MQKRVIITRSNPISPDPRVEKVAATLAASGWQVDVLGWDRSGEEPESQQREYGRLELLRIRAAFGSGIGNLPQLLRWTGGLFWRLVGLREDYDVIHACDFDTLLPALASRMLWRKKVVYDIFDFYAAHLRATPRIFKWVVRHLELWAIGKVNAVILADETRKEQIVGSSPRKLAVIFNTPKDRSAIAGSKERKLKDAHSLSISYVGLLQVERGLLELLDATERHPEWFLDLAGFGGDEAVIAGRAKSIRNVRLDGRIPYERALEVMAAADALIATYDPDIPNHRYASPNKLFEAMMLAKPIVVARGTNMDRIVEKHGCGLVVPYGDVPALEEALAKLASDPAFRARLGAAGRYAYESTYSWDIMSRRLLDLYDQL